MCGTKFNILRNQERNALKRVCSHRNMHDLQKRNNEFISHESAKPCKYVLKTTEPDLFNLDCNFCGYQIRHKVSPAKIKSETEIYLILRKTYF